MEEDKKPQTIKNFLARFKSIVPHDKKIRTQFIEIVRDIHHINILESEVRTVKGNIYMRTTPIKKVEVLRRRELIVRELEQRLGIKNISIS